MLVLRCLYFAALFAAEENPGTGLRPAPATIDLMLQYGACPLIADRRCREPKRNTIPVFMTLSSTSGQQVLNYTTGRRRRRIQCGGQNQDFRLIGSAELHLADEQRKPISGVSLDAREVPNGFELSASWVSYEGGRWLNALCGPEGANLLGCDAKLAM
jgi:hypothetical protein